MLIAPAEGDLLLMKALLPRVVNGNRGFFGGSGVLEALEVTAMPAPLDVLEGATAQPPVGAAGEQEASLTLHCHTPLAIKQDNAELTRADTLRAETLWRIAWRRLTQYCQLAQAALPDAQPWRAAALGLRCDPSGLRYERHMRRSATQGGRLHPVNGFVGSLVLQGRASDIRALSRLLAATLPLQLGKDTVFGLGVCSLEPMAATLPGLG